MIATATCTSLLVSMLLQAKPKTKAKETKPAQPSTAAIEWSESYEKAFEEAKERGAPLMILVFEDGESGSEGLYKSVLSTKEFVEASRHFVNLLVCRTADKVHGTRDEKRGNETVHVCGRFGSINCLQHQKTEQPVMRDFGQNGGLKTPMVIVTQPDLAVLATLGEQPLDAYVTALNDAQAKWPNSFSRDEAAQIRDQLTKVQDQLAAKQFDQVLKFALPIQKRGAKGGLANRVSAAVKEVEDAGKEELTAIEALVTAKDFAPAIERLEAMVSKFRGSTLETIAKERRVALEKSPQVQAALVKAKRESTARELLTSADQLKGKGETEKAEKKYQLLREKFADTAAARELAARGG